MFKISEVKDYWDNHPLFSYEIKEQLGSFVFFKEMDRIKKDDVERFSMNYWNFSDFIKGKTLLDIGCGPGFLTRFYASNGYDVTAIDISKKSTDLTKRSLVLFNLNAKVLEGNAESLAFEDNSFDYVVSSGVLHHTPDTRGSILEAYRVLKPGGSAKITFYYKNLLLKKPFWYLTRFLLKTMAISVPGRSCLIKARTPNEFMRFYDGDTNPIGKGYSLKEARELVSPPFVWAGSEIHFFPMRFMPKWLQINTCVHRLFDSYVGTMIYLNLKKDK